ncbi:DUF317 domain-containing protein [Kitasatospora sp. NPDC059795]|uniref:DUF317 domain-containing protein n=1 Tax=Kitasatospora sp. NPDC059795 TaxID=3346949 RepID=UPI00365408F6
MAPRRLAGPGQPETLRPVLAQRGWRAGTSPDVLLTSSCRRLQLAAVPTEDRTGNWQLRAAEHAGHGPVWSIAFAAGTPVEIVAAVAVHLDDALARNGLRALQGRYPALPVLSTLHNAGWADTDMPGVMVSPDLGPLAVEVLHEPWASAPDADAATLTITAGHQGDDNSASCGFSVGMSNRVPDTIALAVLGAVLDPTPVHRLHQDIPVPHRAAVAPTAPPPPAPTAAAAEPHDALAPLVAKGWKASSHEVGTLSLYSVCERIAVHHVPEPRPGYEHADPPWVVHAMGDGGDGWEAAFGPGTPLAVVSAFTTQLAATVARQDSTALHHDRLRGPDPNVTTPHGHRTDPVEGSLDAHLAHTRLRLAGWRADDQGLYGPGRISCAPTGATVLASFPPIAPGPAGIPALPRQWKLTGRTTGDQQQERWQATFDSRTPTELVLAAAHQAAALTVAPLPTQTAPSLNHASEHDRTRVRAARARTTEPPPSSPRPPAPSTNPPNPTGTPPAPPRHR